MFLRLTPREERKNRRPVLSLKDLAEMCNVTYCHLAKNIKPSGLEPVFIGKKSGNSNRLFYRDELMSWANKNGWLK